MTPKTLARHRRRAAALLLLWAGMVIGFAFLMAPLLFSTLPSRDLAGQVAGKVVARLDIAAWIGFGGAILVLVQGAPLADGNPRGRGGGAPAAVGGGGAGGAADVLHQRLHRLPQAARPSAPAWPARWRASPRTTPTGPPSRRPTASRASSWGCASCWRWAWPPGSWPCPAPCRPGPRQRFPQHKDEQILLLQASSGKAVWGVWG